MSGLDEALLEALYFKPLRDMFEHWAATNGLSFVKILKPSRAEEKLLGFDYGWVTTSLTIRQYVSDLKKEMKNPTGKKFDAYFMQYKVGKRLKNSTSRLRKTGVSLPACSCELKTRRISPSEPSQHEVLKKLSGVPGASVCYSVPEIFSEDDLPRDARIEDLRMFGVDNLTPLYADNLPHHIFFKPGSNKATWASDPVNFTSQTVPEFFGGHKMMSAEQMLELIGEFGAALQEVGSTTEEGAVVWPVSFRVVEFGERETE